MSFLLTWKLHLSILLIPCSLLYLNISLCVSKLHTMAAFPFYLPFFLVFFLPFHALSQTKDAYTKPIGSSLSTSEKNTAWLSPSGDFALGFQQVQDKNHFVLSIWFNKIPDKTMVWFVNQTVVAGSKVNLTADLGLVLSDPQGIVLWNSYLSGTASSGVLNDTGNFMIVASNSSKLWDTFSNPTDTLLPTQDMGAGGVLYSKKNDSDFSSGRFQLRLLGEGTLVLNTREIVSGLAYRPYFDLGTTSGYKLRFSEAGHMSYLTRKEGIHNFTKAVVPPSGNYYRATLGFDGVFAQYSYPKEFNGTTTWKEVWSIPDNICYDLLQERGSGACGYNSVCTLENRRPSCNCPPSYSLLDPNDKYGSCFPNSSLSCDVNGTNYEQNLYDFVELLDTDWPICDYEQLEPVSEIDCKKHCLEDCFCAVAIYREDSCWKKKLPLSHGKIDHRFVGKALLKYRKVGLPPWDPHPDNSRLNGKKEKETLSLVGSVLVGSSIFANVILIGVVCLGCFSIYLKKTAAPKPFNHVVETNLRCFTYNELEEATDGFKEELGRGAFGIVYKGVLPMSSTNIVAVKKLDRLVQEREKEFKIEINVIAQTHHKNLVRLLGFCEDGQHRLLVYEYMANGTLSSYLFGDVKPSWAHRSSIAMAIARGLAYLHEECSTQIIHCDIKPQNILLDEYYNARISDFGLAKLLKINQSRTDTAIRGTRGYVAPDWFRNSPITVKVDVYSFGVLLLEIICCRKSVEDMDLGGEKDILIDWAWDCFQEGKLDSLVENQEDVLNDWSQFETFVMVAIWCIQEDASLRPTMRKVIQMLEGVVDVPKPPCPSLYS